LGLAGIPGVWLVEAVANGQVVRARIQKGSLRLTERPTVAGQVLTVLDEDWRPVKVKANTRCYVVWQVWNRLYINCMKVCLFSGCDV
jgi:hypothetical protein